VTGRSSGRVLPKELADWAERIADYARAETLDFYQTIFEVLTAEQVDQVAAYGGFPQCYPHWRFGMEYEKLRKQQAAQLRLSRAVEWSVLRRSLTWETNPGAASTRKPFARPHDECSDNSAINHYH